MILFNRTEPDPYLNIAAEEYVLKAFDEDVFMLWINSPSVIIGKHQVAAAEADMIYTHRNDIPLIRRISGGGTVYHDEGNLNYSLVSSGKKGKLVDYLKYAGTVIRTLDKLSVKAVLEGKSNLYTANKKFSGNAEHVFKNRVLHHGTLLFNTDLENLRKCICPAHAGYHDKAIRSVDSTTTNLIMHLPQGTSMEDFRNSIVAQVKEDFLEINTYVFSKQDKLAIRRMISDKYGTSNWNFGYSPKYSLSRELLIGDLQMQVEIKTEKGMIIKMEISHEGNEVLPEVSENLKGVMHHPADISDVLNNINFAQFIKDTKPDSFISGLF